MLTRVQFNSPDENEVVELWRTAEGLHVRHAYRPEGSSIYLVVQDGVLASLLQDAVELASFADVVAEGTGLSIRTIVAVITRFKKEE